MYLYYSLAQCIRLNIRKDFHTYPLHVPVSLTLKLDGCQQQYGGGFCPLILTQDAAGSTRFKHTLFLCLVTERLLCHSLTVSIFSLYVNKHHRNKRFQMFIIEKINRLLEHDNNNP